MMSVLFLPMNTDAVMVVSCPPLPTLALGCRDMLEEQNPCNFQSRLAGRAEVHTLLGRNND